MKRYLWILLLLFTVGGAVLPSAAEQRFIVRDSLGVTGIQATCVLLNCKVVLNLGDPSGELFLVTTSDLVDVNAFLSLLQGQLGVVDAELDRKLLLIGAIAGAVPEALMDNTPVAYYGAPVWHGYVYQPASQIVRVLQTQNSFHVAGAGIVAIIDTGVDTEHPALAPVLVPGYDFTRNTSGADEKGDVNQSSAAVLDGGPGEPTYVNQSTIAVINQSSAAVLDGQGAFGHGTMTAGIVHLVAPKARIMPLKSFASDGTGYVSDVIRATYYAVKNGAKVISMSFSFSPSSKEMAKAVDHATGKGLICVASVGNDGQQVLVYPAALANVMGIASTTDYDTRSSFSNYGSDLVWIAAPGEGIVTTYPYSTYAAGWGTSFSAPFVSGTAALLVSTCTTVNQQTAAQALAHAKWISSDLGNGRLDAYMAVQAWRSQRDCQP
jgi:subtilisin family serine protease